MTSAARRLATLLAALAGLGLAGCEAPGPAAKPLIVFEGETMGTTYTIKIAGVPAGSGGVGQARHVTAVVLQGVDDLMTTYRPSEVTAFNRHHSVDPMAISPATREVVQIALDLARQTRGALDITVAPLVSAYGFGNSEPVDRPDTASLAQHVGFDKLSLDASGSLVKADPLVEIDLSAVAKGYAVDLVARALQRQGFADFMVEVGGEVLTRGHGEAGRPWQIAIERPDASRGTVARVVALGDSALATSGDYRNFRRVNGRRVSHIVDPRTMRPIEHPVASASVVHPSCAAADGLATAMMVLGDEGLDLAEENGWAVMLLIRRDGGFVERQSTAFARLLESEPTAQS